MGVESRAASVKKTRFAPLMMRFVGVCAPVQNCHPFQTDVDHPAVTVVKILSVHRTMPSVRDSAWVVKSLRYQMAVGRRAVIAEMTLIVLVQTLYASGFA